MSTTDRWLLELAAKAAGFAEYKFNEELGEIWCKGHGMWCPLSDDGDALRLAAKLMISIDLTDDSNEEVRTLTQSGMHWTELLDGSGDLSPIRYAIVGAAAHIGRSMP